MLRKRRNTLIMTIIFLLLLGIFCIRKVSYAKGGVANSLGTADKDINIPTSIDSVYNERLNSLLLNTNDQVFEKYANLLIICHCQVASLYSNGEIPEDWYLKQKKPFIDGMNNLFIATDKEILDSYKSLLWYLYDTMTEDEAAGYEIDHNLFYFVLDEINYYDVQL